MWTTAFNYLVPMTMMIVLNMVLLPMFGGQYNQAFLSAACWVCIGMGAVRVGDCVQNTGRCEDVPQRDGTDAVADAGAVAGHANQGVDAHAHQSVAGI